MRFLVKNYDIFKLPGNRHMLHLGTIGYGLREFVVMYCTGGEKAGNMYIEEAVLHSVDFSKDVYAGFKFIKDDNLARELAAYASEKNMTNMVDIGNRLFSTGRGSWLMEANGS
jgi:hypothetical protein